MPITKKTYLKKHLSHKISTKFLKKKNIISYLVFNSMKRLYFEYLTKFFLHKDMSSMISL